MQPETIWIRKQWIASCNAEWCWRAKQDAGGKRGGPTIAAAVADAERHVDLTHGATIIIEPDMTRGKASA